MSKDSISILLGDLRHNTIGRHSNYVPVSLGMIAAHTRTVLADVDVHIEIHDDPQEMLQALSLRQFELVGLSNYCWNTSLSSYMARRIKDVSPQTLVVVGGPEFPEPNEERRAYLAERPGMDLYAFSEGEQAFAAAATRLLEMEGDLDALLRGPVAGCFSLDPASGELLCGEDIPPLLDRDEIPSPYLTGELDRFLTGQHVPALETARGCPFKCGYCHSGSVPLRPICFFSAGRVVEELHYIAERLKDHKGLALSLFDTNFAMYERDQVIADCIEELIETHDWPRIVEATTGKHHFDRIFSISRQLHHRMAVSMSQQSLNKETLEVIRRRNMPLDLLLAMSRDLRARNIKAFCELIIPLPLETKESYFDALRYLIESGVNVITYTTMLLKSTMLTAPSTRERYAFQTRWRIIPRQFGEYEGSRCLELEEVICATSTMTFEEYLDCRAFAFICYVFSSDQFDILPRLTEEFGLSKFDLLMSLWERIKKSGTPFGAIYERFLAETREELLPSREAAEEFYSRPEVYERLLKGEIGDNLLRKYRTLFFLEDAAELFSLVGGVLEGLLGQDGDVLRKRAALDALMLWCGVTRDLRSFAEADISGRSEVLSLPYDVNAWYESPRDGGAELLDFKDSVTYEIGRDDESVRQFLADLRATTGNDPAYTLSQILVRRRINTLWRRTRTR